MVIFFNFLVKLTSPLVDLIVQQQLTGEVKLGKILTVKKELRQLSRLSIICQAANLHNSLDAKQKRLITMTKVKGSSIWLTSLPLDVHGFFLHKGEFRDALCLRYGWTHPYLAFVVLSLMLTMH